MGVAVKNLDGPWKKQNKKARQYITIKKDHKRLCQAECDDSPFTMAHVWNICSKAGKLNEDIVSGLPSFKLRPCQIPHNRKEWMAFLDFLRLCKVAVLPFNSYVCYILPPDEGSDISYVTGYWVKKSQEQHRNVTEESCNKSTTRIVPKEYTETIESERIMLERIISTSACPMSPVTPSVDLVRESAEKTVPSNDHDVKANTHGKSQADLKIPGKAHSGGLFGSITQLDDNFKAWPLPTEISVKIFSLLDTRSLCCIAVVCSMFKSCAMDPLCYVHIDITTKVPKASNALVSTMIQRAGKEIQSLKLGIVPGTTTLVGSREPLAFSLRVSDINNFSSILTGSCLSSLSEEGAFARSCLRKLQLYNIKGMDKMTISSALEACPYLLDLEIVGLQEKLRDTLPLVSKNCRLIERIFFESSLRGMDESLQLDVCSHWVKKCPNLSSLSLRRFRLSDRAIQTLLKGFQNLTYVDFSLSYAVRGRFLRFMGNCERLQVLILRNLLYLNVLEVIPFLKKVRGGCCSNLKLMDISNTKGLSTETKDCSLWWVSRCYETSIFDVEALRETRPNFCLKAEFPREPMTEIQFNVDSSSIYPEDE